MSDMNNSFESLDAYGELAGMYFLLASLLGLAHRIVDSEEEIKKIQRVLKTKMDETEDI